MGLSLSGPARTGSTHRKYAQALSSSARLAPPVELATAWKASKRRPFWFFLALEMMAVLARPEIEELVMQHVHGTARVSTAAAQEKEEVTGGEKGFQSSGKPNDKSGPSRVENLSSKGMNFQRR